MGGSDFITNVGISPAIGSSFSLASCVLLVLAPRNRDRSFGLGARAFHVEPAVAHAHLVAAQNAHALEAAGGAGRGVVLRHGEDDGGHGAYQIEELRLGLAVALGVELDGIIVAAAADRQLLGR